MKRLIKTFIVMTLVLSMAGMYSMNIMAEDVAGSSDTADGTAQSSVQTVANQSGAAAASAADAKTAEAVSKPESSSASAKTAAKKTENLKSADEVSTNDFNFVTGVTITKSGSSEEELGDSVSGEGSCRINYEFKIPNSVSVKAGDKYTIKIPDEIKIYNDINLALKDNAGDVIANLVISKNSNNAGGTGVITFTEKAASESNVGGNFYIDSSFTQTVTSNQGTKYIDFECGSDKTYSVKVDFATFQPDIKKSGVYDIASQTITWTVKVNSQKYVIEGGVMTDAVQDGQTYIDGSFSDDPGDGAFKYSDGTLTYTFPSSTRSMYTFIYKTKVADSKVGSWLNNKAVFKDANGHSIDSSASVEAKEQSDSANYDIVKTGIYNVATGNIDWTVTFDSTGSSLKNVGIKDDFNTGNNKDLTLVSGSVKYDGAAVQLSDETGQINNLETGKYSYFKGTDGYMHLWFKAGDIDKKHTLTFSTSLPENYFQTNHSDINNGVSIWSGNDYKNSGYSGWIGIGNTAISKSHDNYDGKTNTIQWYVDVNANKKDLKSAKIVDTIPSGLTYVDGSISIYSSESKNYVTVDSSKLSVSKDNLTGVTTLTYTLGDVKAGTAYRLGYKTSVDDKSVAAGNGSVKFDNKVALISGDTGNTTNTDTNSSINVYGNSLAKSGTYDYNTHELTWTVKVNGAGHELTGVSLTDDLSSGELADFVLEESTISGLGSNGSYTYDKDSGKLTFKFSELKNEQKIITFKMKMSESAYEKYLDSNDKSTVANTVTMISDQNSSNTTATANVDIQGSKLSKTYSYTDGNAYIDWGIKVNQGGSDVSGLKITDTLIPGLELDTSSLALYKSDHQGNKGELLTENIKYSYDASTNIFTFYIPDEYAKEPCYVTYRTNITDSRLNGESISNSVTMEGKMKTTTAVATVNKVSFSTAGGGGYGETGSVTVRKVDSADKTKTLKGAKFALFDKNGNKIRADIETGDDGTVNFSRLKYETPYYIQETGAPAGYILDASKKWIEFDANGKLQMGDAEGQNYTAVDSMTITVENTADTIDKTVTKVWDDNNNSANKRPDSIRIQLYADGQAYGDLITLTANSKWTYKWTGLQKNKDGKEITYTAKEVNVPAGYYSEVTESNTETVITNVYNNSTNNGSENGNHSGGIDKHRGSSSQRAVNSDAGLINTGDTSNMLMWVSLGAAAIAAIIALAAIRRRHNR